MTHRPRFSKIYCKLLTPWSVFKPPLANANRHLPWEVSRDIRFPLFYAAIQHKVALRTQQGDEREDAVQEFTDGANTEQERRKLEGSVRKTITCQERTANFNQNKNVRLIAAEWIVQLCVIAPVVFAKMALLSLPPLDIVNEMQRFECANVSVLC